MVPNGRGRVNCAGKTGILERKPSRRLSPGCFHGIPILLSTPDCYIDPMTPKITDELNQALHQHHGLVEAEGSDGKVVVMTMQVYRELMGVGSDEELQASVQAIEVGFADVESGHTKPMDQVFRELDEKHELQD